jgi:cytochrome c biogenesis protein CcmG, thiol:disulfide interchange protein DsbE
MKRIWLWIPFAIFATLIAVFAAGLINPSDRTIASGLVGRPVPQFTLPGALDPAAGLTTQYFGDGKPKLLNVFASWCVPCVAEAPALMQLQEQGAQITGIAVHDRPEALLKFLSENGNPYSKIGDDAQSRTQIAFGSAGVPETFVVDGKGVIRHQHVGIITPDDVPIIMAKLRSAQ